MPDHLGRENLHYRNRLVASVRPSNSQTQRAPDGSWVSEVFHKLEWSFLFPSSVFIVLVSLHTTLILFFIFIFLAFHIIQAYACSIVKHILYFLLLYHQIFAYWAFVHQGTTVIEKRLLPVVSLPNTDPEFPTFYKEFCISCE